MFDSVFLRCGHSLSSLFLFSNVFHLCPPGVLGIWISHAPVWTTNRQHYLPWQQILPQLVIGEQHAGINLSTQNAPDLTDKVLTFRCWE